MQKNSLVTKYLELTESLKPYPPLNNYAPFIQASEWNTARYFDKFYDNRTPLHLIDVIDDDESFVMLTENKLRDCSKEVFLKYLKDQKILKEREEGFYSRIDQAEKLYLEYTYSKINRDSSDELIAQVDSIRDLIWEGNALAFFSTFFEKEFCLEILKEAKFDLSLEELDEVWDKAIHPVSDSFEKQQLRFFLNLVSGGKNWQEIVESCQFFTASYYDVKSLETTGQYLNDHYQKFKESEAAKAELTKMDRAAGIKLEEFNQWCNNLNRNQQILVDFIQSIIKIRDNRKNFFSKGITALWRIAQKEFKMADLSEDLIRFYTVYEMKKGLDYLIQNKDKITARKSGFIILINYDGSISMDQTSISQAKEDFGKYYLESQGVNVKEDIKEIRGQVGSPGSIKGTVRVVFDPAKEADFQEGNILVAGMTRPEFVPLMRKASGFITDEGGITCHAAIVAREMKKPCVVGTKIATKILQDGDMVEMDADKGIVKIIKE